MRKSAAASASAPSRGSPSNPFNSTTVGRNSSAKSSCASGSAAKTFLYVLLLVAVVVVAVVVYYAFSLRNKRKASKKNMSGSASASGSKTGGEVEYVRYPEAEGFEEEATAAAAKSSSASKTGKKKGGYRLIYFHMLGCVYCRKFDPIWKTFKSRYSSKLKSEQNVRLVSFGSDDKKAKGFSVNGFPTVLLARADSDDVVAVFEGERSVANLKKFVDEKTR